MLRQLDRRLRPLFWRFGHTPTDNLIQRRRGVRTILKQTRWRIGAVPEEFLRWVGTLIRYPAGESVEECAAQRVNVSADVHAHWIAGLLGSEEIGRADNKAFLCEAVFLLVGRID